MIVDEKINYSFKTFEADERSKDSNHYRNIIPYFLWFGCNFVNNLLSIFSVIFHLMNLIKLMLKDFLEKIGFKEMIIDNHR